MVRFWVGLHPQAPFSVRLSPGLWVGLPYFQRLGRPHPEDRLYCLLMVQLLLARVRRSHRDRLSLSQGFSASISASRLPRQTASPRHRVIFYVHRRGRRRRTCRRLQSNDLYRHPPSCAKRICRLPGEAGDLGWSRRPPRRRTLLLLCRQGRSLQSPAHSHGVKPKPARRKRDRRRQRDDR